MKLLFDANLSYRLVRKLNSVFPDCIHVTRTGLPIPAEDMAIWQWATVHECLIVTNDEDFYNLANVYGFPPKVVLLRMGSQSTESIAEILLRHHADLHSLAESAEIGLLELY